MILQQSNETRARLSVKNVYDVQEPSFTEKKKIEKSHLRPRDSGNFPNPIGLGSQGWLF
jgi:hypothetical protein